MAGYARKSLTRNQRRRKVVVQKLMGIALIAICALMFWLASTGVTPEEKDCTAVLLIAPIGLYMKNDRSFRTVMVNGSQTHRRQYGLALWYPRNL